MVVGAFIALVAAGAQGMPAFGTTFTDADDIWGSGTVGDRASAGVDAHFGAEKTFDYFQNAQGRAAIWATNSAGPGPYSTLSNTVTPRRS